MKTKQIKLPGPDHPISIQPNPARVVVSVAGRVVADTRNALTLREAGLFKLIRNTPDALRYEHQLIVAEGDYVIVHGRFSGTGRPVAWIAADIVRIENGRLAEHWDVLQDEATKAESKSGLPMFGDRFTA